MPACSAYGCTNRSDRKTPGLTFHRFPKDECRRTQWLISVRRQNFTPTHWSVLCSDHFSEDMFLKTSTTVRLKKNAVPTIFPFSPDLKQDGKQPTTERLAVPSSEVFVNADDPSPIISVTDNLIDSFDVSNASVLPDGLDSFDIKCWLNTRGENTAVMLSNEIRAQKRELDELEETLERQGEKIKILHQKVKVCQSMISNFAENVKHWLKDITEESFN